MARRCGRLIDSNAYPPCARGALCIVIYSGCIDQLYPTLLDSIPEFNECACFSACPEETHINMLGFKLAGLIARAREVKRVVVFTVDGSMHCVQLHYMLEELEKIGVLKGVVREHYVYEGGKVVRIPPQAVKYSRYLTRVAKLLKKSSTT